MTITREEAQWFFQAFGQIANSVSQAVLGKNYVVRLAVTALLAEGHILLEDAPSWIKMTYTQDTRILGAGLHINNPKITKC